MSPPDPPTLDLETLFGPLELRVLDALWAKGGSRTVRQVMREVQGVAYTTLLTTLDRLYRKGLLERERAGRAFSYRPAATRDQLTSKLARGALESLMPADPGSIRPLLSTFVAEVGRRDAALLDELAEQIRRHREEEP